MSQSIVSRDGVGGHVSWLRCGKQEMYKPIDRENSFKKDPFGILINKYVYKIKIDVKRKS
jgi:hypothetical protein